MRNFGQIYDSVEDGSAESWARRQTPLGIAFKVFLGILVLSLLGGVIGWIGGWFGEAKRVTSPANVTNQYATVIGDWQALITESQNACSAVRAAHSADDPTFVEDPALAYEARYRSTRADYNRRMQNIFEAGLVGPHGYPRTVPNLSENNWCTVADGLLAVHS